MSIHDVVVVGGGAAGEDSAAAIAMNADLVDDDVLRAVQDSHRGAPV